LLGPAVIRLLIFAGLAGALVAYAVWIYVRVELPVAGARRLAAVRAVVLVVVLALLFDPRLPGLQGGVAERWVLLDASLSMSTADGSEGSSWTAASIRARELAADGWSVARFGDVDLVPVFGAPGEPDRLTSLLTPALTAAAESGAREVIVLSDMRFQDAVALRAAVEALPVVVDFEPYGRPFANAGIGRFAVPDVLQPDGVPVAEVEVFGGQVGDSIEVVVSEEEREVASRWIGAPSEGLRTVMRIELPPASGPGRVRYTVELRGEPDGFPDDDMDVAYANIGHQAGALVLVSLSPDWEPRFLLPVLGEVTGLPVAGYLRAGADRYVRMGVAADRGPPADSASVRRAAEEAAVLVVQGVGVDAEVWVSTLLSGPGRRLVLPVDAEGARLAGVATSGRREGEWYASPDIPTSPIAGSLTGVSLQGLPPLTGVLIPDLPATQPPLLMQLAGTGSPVSAFHLLERPSGRVAVALASDYWRWAMRDSGREPYRRLWSGVIGWLLEDTEVTSAEVRPSRWVVERGVPVEWSIPGDTIPIRLVVTSTDSVVVDTTVARGAEGGSVGEAVSTGVLPPGVYTYSATDDRGDTLTSGRFDVTPATTELLPPRMSWDVPPRSASSVGARDGRGRPLRTSPWPYLLVILLLCAEWVVRRRSGLR
jgi:hypothetical protein